ncbi:MAG: hypothetical protein PHE78_07865, partial [Candidatus Gastranaerophilales bacterium]|nr:hypothetical protein [Candidatus Gastranaerophilales bacterium]
CNLGSINLARFVENGQIDWDRLAQVTKDSIHFLDNVITVNNYPLPQISEMVQNNRKIGLGVMGWADMLMMLDTPYNSSEGVKLAYQVFEFIDYHSKVMSIELAEKRGAFQNFKGSIYDGQNFLSKKYTGKSAGLISDEQWAELDERIAKVGIRNATTTCIAPTGTISMIASASGGVEPLFGLVFIRNVMDGTEMIEVNGLFEERCKKEGIYSKELMKAISDNHGSIYGVAGVPSNIEAIFATAHDVSPEWHVKMQAAFQLHTDNAVSKTVNFEEHATREDIEKTYYLAYEYKLKGITVYRNNSRTFQPMNTTSAEKSAVDQIEIKEVDEMEASTIKEVVCKECGHKIQYSEGCYICLNCGASGCS